ncbi:hypothetical protein ACFL5Y_02310 [Candidatus Omnitrophota bacterium]
MKKMISVFCLAGLLLAGTACVHANAVVKIAIKYGMYEENVNKAYGQPVLTEKIKDTFWPIPKKKALYKIGESDYIILYFFSGRINKITILSDINPEEATAMFQQK